jgi:hypothetical protein
MRQSIEAQQMQFLRSLKGAAASILITMMLVNRTFEQKELMQLTNYSDKTIQSGLELLLSYGIVERPNRFAWRLSDGLRQLPLFPQSVLAAYSQNPRAGIILEQAVDNSDTEKFRVPSDVSDRDTEFPTHRHGNSPSDLTRVTTTFTTTTNHRETDSSSSSSEDTEKLRVQQLLVNIGIAPHSKKMNQLMSKGLTLEFVQAHFLQFLYEVEVQKRDHVIGLLITRLLEADKAPDMRCAEHLEHHLPCRACELRNLVRR